MRARRARGGRTTTKQGSLYYYYSSYMQVNGRGLHGGTLSSVASHLADARGIAYVLACGGEIRVEGVFLVQRRADGVVGVDRARPAEPGIVVLLSAQKALGREGGRGRGRGGG